jgi:hypothetical protein
MNTPQGQQELLPMKDVTPKKNAAEPAKTKEKVAPKAAAAPPPASPPAKTKKKAGTAVAVHKPQAPAQQKNVLQIIADVASRPDANPTVMRELLDMQKEKQRSSDTILMRQISVLSFICLDLR